MMKIAHFAIFAVTLVVCLADGLGSDSHNYINCPKPDAAKSLLLDQRMTIRGKFLATQKRTFLFPDETINTKRITCIMITDMSGDGHGGYIEVVDGGIGNYDVTIHFTTEFGRGMDFRIRIYGE